MPRRVLPSLKRTVSTSMGLRHRLASALAVGVLVGRCAAQPPVPDAAQPSPPAATASPSGTAGQQCSGLTLSASRQSPITAGDIVTIAAQAGGCGSPEYRFVLLDQTGGTTVMQDWGHDATWTWNSGNSLSGLLTVRADARAKGSTSYAPDVSSSRPFQVSPPAPPAVQTCRLPVSGVLPGSG